MDELHSIDDVYAVKNEAMSNKDIIALNVLIEEETVINNNGLIKKSKCLEIKEICLIKFYLFT